jgi:endonuclease-8
VPEGDTIYRTAAVLRAALLGKAVVAFDAPRLMGIRPALGCVIEYVESQGKHLEIGFDDGVVLHTHMRMTGSWHLYRIGEQWRRAENQARVIIEVAGWQAVCFSTNVVETYRAREFSRHPNRSLGPDLCREHADLDECVRRIGRYCDATTTVAEVLLDQRVACGVGNVYKSEVLWVCELHPFTPIGSLVEEQRANLLRCASDLLRANLDNPNRITVPGVPGGQAVYARHGKPCFRCGAPIEVERHGEQARATYWCAQCQLYIPLPPPEVDADRKRVVAAGRWFGRVATSRAAAEELARLQTAELPVILPGQAASWDVEPLDDGLSVFAEWDDAVFDPHPAARALVHVKPRGPQPTSVDPLLSRREN